jgi:hypothetical protein
MVRIYLNLDFFSILKDLIINYLLIYFFQSLTVRNDETRNSNIIDIRNATNIDPYVFNYHILEKKK